jgi:uncharacterized protein (DUF2267 family)
MSTSATVDSIERTVQRTKEWVADLERALGRPGPREPRRAPGGYLQVLRDRVTADDGAQLAAQLPQLLRGVVDEGFDSGHHPEMIRGRETFLRTFADRAALDGLDEAARVAAAATRVPRRHTSAGEVERSVPAARRAPARSSRATEPRVTRPWPDRWCDHRAAGAGW